MTMWTQHCDVWRSDTPVGRYVIRRYKRSSREFKLWLNGRPTKYIGTVEWLKRTVDSILSVRES
jgi:hypothetical protein